MYQRINRYAAKILKCIGKFLVSPIFILLLLIVFVIGFVVSVIKPDGLKLPFLIKSELSSSSALTFIAVTFTIATAILGCLKYYHQEYRGHKNKNLRLAEARRSLKRVVSYLSSPNNSLQLSAAIMLRRFLETGEERPSIETTETEVKTDEEADVSILSSIFKDELNEPIAREFPSLKKDTINVISSQLRVLPTGVFQKTLADGLAYAEDLSFVDLQKTNLQCVYLGKKGKNDKELPDREKISLDKTDFYMADLSRGLIENVIGKAIFYQSVLFSASIKKSNLSDADFYGADLTRAHFKDVNLENAKFQRTILTDVVFDNVKLQNADFTDAINIPTEIDREIKKAKAEKEKADKAKADKENADKYPLNIPVYTGNKTKELTIFMSMPSVARPDRIAIINSYRDFLYNKGYDVIYYQRDDYPMFGQMSRIRREISGSSGIIVFGFEQIKINNGIYRSHTNNEEYLKDVCLSTPWNELEVGMAVAKGIPILLVNDPSIKRGIFDDNLRECFVFKTSSEESLSNLDQNSALSRWLDQVKVFGKPGGKGERVNYVYKKLKY